MFRQIQVYGKCATFRRRDCQVLEHIGTTLGMRAETWCLANSVVRYGFVTCEVSSECVKSCTKLEHNARDI